MFEDSINFAGHFTVQTINSKTQEVIDEYIDNNMIMQSARQIMAERLLNVTSRPTIDKIVIGTQGHKTGDILTPKDASDGFVSTRTELFSEELAEYFYPIEFTIPGTSSGSCTDIIEPSIGSTVSVFQTDSDVTYTVSIAANAANDGTSTVYTEAALYAGTNIFSMKTFRAKIKDDSTIIRIIWKISF